MIHDHDLEPYNAILQAKKRFSSLLGITFEEIPSEGVEPARIEPGPKAIALASDRPPQEAGERVRVVSNHFFNSSVCTK